MFTFINIPARILTILQLNITPRQVAMGVCLGLFLGFIPLNGPMAFLLFLFFLIFKINRFSTALTLPFFKLVYLLGASTLAERLGGYLLIDAKSLTDFWRQVTGLPVLALLDLNNTLICGGIALSFVLCLPVYLVARFVYVSWIEKNLLRIQNSKFAKRLSRNKLVNKVVLKMDYIRSKT